MDAVDVFVPGRVCLLGEHTDWAVLHRGKFPSEPMSPGHCLVYGTNCGLYAKAFMTPTQDGKADTIVFKSAVTCAPPEPHLNVLQSHDVVASYCIHHDGSMTAEISLPLDTRLLDELARTGNYFSYFAGAVSVTLPSCADALAGHSLVIDNYRTDLPVGKGLSSSAALCVLVVRCLSRLAGLTLTVEHEMELAYQGERRTPSQCGRMDQCVAFGNAPVSMLFDGETVRCSRIQLSPSATPFYFVVADMNRAKDTQRILSDLGSCFLVDARAGGDSAAAAKARLFLSKVSGDYADRAMRALKAGDHHGLGIVFDDYQRAFDEHLQPVCPTELTSPRLHELLTHPEVRKHVLGGKGVGSQGDGSIQFLCATKCDQEMVSAILEREGCHCFSFELAAQPSAL